MTNYQLYMIAMVGIAGIAAHDIVRRKWVSSGISLLVFFSLVFSPFTVIGAAFLVAAMCVMVGGFVVAGKRSWR